jgi:hypothetical protein
MASCSLVWHGREVLSSRWLLVFLLVGLPASTSFGAEQPPDSTAARLVHEALEAEVSGDTARHAALLQEAVRVAPNYNLARWHSGQIEVADDWISVEDAQQAAAADERLAEYRRLRTEYGDSPTGQLALARWCRKSNLHDEARLHWASVLSVQPNHEEAQRALGVRWYHGRLMTYAQIEHAKGRMKASRKAAKRWAPKITKWQRDIADELDVREQALDEIRAVKDIHAIAALEEVTLDPDLSNELQTTRSRQFSLAVVEALDVMPDQAAAESLVRHAVFAPLEDVRGAAIDALKNRVLHDYVPLLLSGLSMPIESWCRIATDPDGSVHYQHSLYVDGRQADWAVEASRSAWQHDLHSRPFFAFRDGRVIPMAAESDASVAARKSLVAAQSQRRFVAAAKLVEQQVEGFNHNAAAMNQQIVPVLTSTTDQGLGEDPQAWWDWWRDYNEYYESGDEPVYERTYSESNHYVYRPPELVRQMSCFARGTLVWTKTGRQPIESLEIGDLVLAQNPDTGELYYKPIVGRTVRPPSDILNMKLAAGNEQEELHTTLGHPLWVAGVGWRMAKQLGDGAVLHGVVGPVKVAAIEPAGQAEAYNLVVAEFNTYFVGESGVLVHDNTPRAPTRATVPGLIEDEVEPAADVAANR